MAEASEDQVSQVQRKVLHTLDQAGSIEDTEAFAATHSVDHAVVIGVIKSLESRELVATTLRERVEFVPSAEGKSILEQGSPEILVFRAVPDAGITVKDLETKLGPVAKIGQAQCMAQKWLRNEKGTLFRNLSVDPADAVRLTLRALEADPTAAVIPKEDLEKLKKRKLASQVARKWFTVTRGAQFTTNPAELITDLTVELLASGQWERTEMKPFNLQARGKPPTFGALHPLLKMRQEYREIFLEMGFEEMPTNRYVESSFWNFDSLFQPQSHPARDAHDTFFLTQPARTLDIPAEYLTEVKKVHEAGGYGSLGYRYDWKEEEARKNILRTHTTAISARMLYKLAEDYKQHGFRPVKYFSIDKVFRNEATDATHLAEFHQVEGVIMDRGLTLGDLIGILSEFFKRQGIEAIKFKPAFNPYTEPSMEIFGYHNGRWMEVGNSGMFRPEMLLPMGFPEDVRVIAWGLGVERNAMMKYKLKDIRDLCGHLQDVKLVHSNPICRLDK